MKLQAIKKSLAAVTAAAMIISAVPSVWAQSELDFGMAAMDEAVFDLAAISTGTADQWIKNGDGTYTWTVGDPSLYESEDKSFTNLQVPLADFTTLSNGNIRSITAVFDVQGSSAVSGSLGANANEGADVQWLGAPWSNYTVSGSGDKTVTGSEVTAVLDFTNDPLASYADNVQIQLWECGQDTVITLKSITAESFGYECDKWISNGDGSYTLMVGDTSLYEAEDKEWITLNIPLDSIIKCDHSYVKSISADFEFRGAGCNGGMGTTIGEDEWKHWEWSYNPGEGDPSSFTVTMDFTDKPLSQYSDKFTITPWWVGEGAVITVKNITPVIDMSNIEKDKWFNGGDGSYTLKVGDTSLYEAEDKEWINLTIPFSDLTDYNKSTISSVSVDFEVSGGNCGGGIGTTVGEGEGEWKNWEWSYTPGEGGSSSFTVTMDFTEKPLFQYSDNLIITPWWVSEDTVITVKNIRAETDISGMEKDKWNDNGNGSYTLIVGDISLYQPEDKQWIELPVPIDQITKANHSRISSISVDFETSGSGCIGCVATSVGTGNEADEWKEMRWEYLPDRSNPSSFTVTFDFTEKPLSPWAETLNICIWWVTEDTVITVKNIRAEPEIQTDKWNNNGDGTYTYIRESEPVEGEEFETLSIDISKYFDEYTEENAAAVRYIGAQLSVNDGGFASGGIGAAGCDDWKQTEYNFEKTDFDGKIRAVVATPEGIVYGGSLEVQIWWVNPGTELTVENVIIGFEETNKWIKNEDGTYSFTADSAFAADEKYNLDLIPFLEEGRSAEDIEEVKISLSLSENGYANGCIGASELRTDSDDSWKAAEFFSDKDLKPVLKINGVAGNYLKLQVWTLTPGSTLIFDPSEMAVSYAQAAIVKPKITKVIPGDGQVGLNWSASPGAAQYAVYYHNGSKWVNAGTTTGLGKYVRGLTNGKKYGFAVKAYVGGKWTDITSEDIVYATPAAAVTKPKITKVIPGNGQVGLNWTSVTGATKYAVYYKNGSKWVNAGTTTGLGKYVRGLANGTKYGFAVKAYVGGKWTDITSKDIVYAAPSAPVTKPKITKTIVGDGQVGLNWTSVTGATKYAVYYKNGSKWVNAGTTTGLGKYVRGLANGTKYGFAVKAYVGGKWTDITSSDIVYATPAAAAAKPKITKAVPGNGQVALNWTSVTGATQYAVYYKSGSKWVNAGTTTALGKYVRGLANGTKYGFAVKAYVGGKWTDITSSDIVYATPAK